MKKSEKVEVVENLLFELIGLGGGDGETLREYAEKIVAALGRKPK